MVAHGTSLDLLLTCRLELHNMLILFILIVVAFLVAVDIKNMQISHLTHLDTETFYYTLVIKSLGCVSTWGLLDCYNSVLTS